MFLVVKHEDPKVSNTSNLYIYEARFSTFSLPIFTTFKVLHSDHVHCPLKF